MKNKYFKLDIDAYDKSPMLSHTEMLEVTILLKKWKKVVHWEKELKDYDYPSRLLDPVRDYSQNLGFYWKATASATGILIYWMHRTGKIFWAWSETEWNEVLRESAIAFLEYYNRYHYARTMLFGLAYLCGNYRSAKGLGKVCYSMLAERVFDKDEMDRSLERVMNEMIDWGYSPIVVRKKIPTAIKMVLLANGSPRLQDIEPKVYQELIDELKGKDMGKFLFKISRVLLKMGFLPSPLNSGVPLSKKENREKDTVPDIWLDWCHRWADISSVTSRYRLQTLRHLYKIGRFLAERMPEMTAPDKWDRGTALKVIKGINDMRVGQWNAPDCRNARAHLARWGDPLSFGSKQNLIFALKSFFSDCQEKGWLDRRWNPMQVFHLRSFGATKPLPSPRNIRADIWAKLLYAGLNIEQEDLPTAGRKGKSGAYYPLEMFRAVSVVWLFSGLRNDEICRLRIDCIQIRKNEDKRVCWLNVPLNKTSPPFTKPVDSIVGDAIKEWLKVRPKRQPRLTDRKDLSSAEFLFSFRGRKLGYDYINTTVIPVLCKKSGIPRKDTKGKITSHRARSTIATQLFNAKEPLSIFDLKEWLGHRFLSSTEYYARMNPTKMEKAYRRAGYFERNLRTIEVLIDQEAIRNGTAGENTPWKYYDLGHGYCTYDFFDQCPHRMACAKCSFYLPKDDMNKMFGQGIKNLQRMLQEIPLNDEEKEAVMDGKDALEKLSKKLSNVPTPSGLTPLQIRKKHNE